MDISKSLNHTNMENTTENRLRFFSLYLGNRVLKYSHSESESIAVLGAWELSSISDKINVFHLELRSIESITDEECIEFFDLTANPKTLILLVDNINKIHQIRFHINWKLANNKSFEQIEIDWFRLKGFLVPFMNLTTDQIIEFGWAKIKYNEQKEN